MKHTTKNIQDNLIGFSELSNHEMSEINGGVAWYLLIVPIFGAMAAAAYLYEFGYNMVDKAFANAK